MTRAGRVGSSASRSSDGTRRSCTTPRSTRRASTLATSCSSSTRTRWRTPSARRVAPTGSASASPRRTSAWSPGSCDEVEPDADTIGAVNNVVRRDDGSLLGFNSDAPGFRAGVELAMGRSLDGAAVVVAGAGGAAHAVVFACLRAGAREVIVGNRTAGSATALVQRFAGVGRGARSAVALDDPAFAAALGSADLAVNATTVGMLDPGATIAGRAAAAGCDRVRPGLRPGRDAPPRRRLARVACERRTARRC